jgi:glycosyltransferase involved in cell wall biosynthesis
VPALSAYIGKVSFTVGVTRSGCDLNILHVTPRVTMHGGGIAAAALGLAEAQTQLDHRVTINCAETYDDSAPNVARYEIISSATRGPAHLGYSPAGERWATTGAASEFDVLHQHGVWPLFSRVTRVWRKAHKKPTLVAPHGSFEAWAMRQSTWKKRLAACAYERSNLAEANCLHATAWEEIASIRAFGLTRPVAVIPNGVPEGWLGMQGSGEDFRHTHNVPPDARIMLFLSRLHPSKGVLDLIEAFAAERDAHPDWHIVLAGPMASDSYEDRLRHAITQHQLGQRVHIVGTLGLKAKRDAMAAAELFVLPTLSDNFAIVIAEALAVGLPVLTTQGAIAWKSIEGHRCGWRIPLGPGYLTEGLRTALSLPAHALAEMGARGIDLIRQQFLWSHAAERSLDVYDWLLGRRARPAIVFD